MIEVNFDTNRLWLEKEDSVDSLSQSMRELCAIKITITPPASILENEIGVNNFHKNKRKFCFVDERKRTR